MGVYGLVVAIEKTPWSTILMVSVANSPGMVSLAVGNPRAIFVSEVCATWVRYAMLLPPARTDTKNSTAKILRSDRFEKNVAIIVLVDKSILNYGT